MGRRIVCTDIHGCFFSFKQLLEEKVKLQRKDTLYFLGDAINKGPYSKEVLDYFIRMRQIGFDVHFLRGNHEQELLKTLTGETHLDVWMSKGGGTLLTNFNVRHPVDIPQAYIDFVHGFRYFFELPDFYMVHSGFDFTKSNPFIESEEVLKLRDYHVDLGKTKGKKLLHGHSPTDLEQIITSLTERNSLHYSLDAGCVYHRNGKQAHLLALDIDSWKIYVQPNIDVSTNYST